MKLALYFSIITNLMFGAAYANEINFSVGRNWDRTPVVIETIENENIKNLAYATAKIYGKIGARGKDVGVGAGIYLGQHEGRLIVMTNNHVIPSDTQCSQIGVIRFQYFGQTQCSKVIISLPDIDMSLIALKVANKETFKDIPPLLFDTQSQFEAGTALSTVGFGSFRNPEEVLTIDQSENCMLMRSTTKDFQIRTNNAKTPIPTLVHGCEQSSGDSGSAIVDAASGKIIGLSFFVATERSPQVRLDENIHAWVQSQPKEMLATLAYAIPSTAIKKSLAKSLEENKKIDKNDKAIIRSVLKNFE